jgi:hypothetical protein
MIVEIEYGLENGAALRGQGEPALAAQLAVVLEPLGLQLALPAKRLGAADATDAILRLCLNQKRVVKDKRATLYEPRGLTR